MSVLFIFEIKNTKKDKISNFLKGRFSVMGYPMGMIFGLFLEIYGDNFFQYIAKVALI